MPELVTNEEYHVTDDVTSDPENTSFSLTNLKQLNYVETQRLDISKIRYEENNCAQE